MSMHPSLRIQHINRRHGGQARIRHPGQAWGSDRKKGLVPSRERPTAPRTRGRPGHGFAEEQARIEAAREERMRRAFD